MSAHALLVAVVAQAQAEVVIDVSKAPLVGETNNNYASWTIDASYNRGFVHIDFDNPNLLAAAKMLGPSTIRFGGGGNDYLQYSPFVVGGCNSSHDNDSYVCLNTSHWDSLYKFANKSGTAFIFGISYDMVAACKERGNYSWSPEPAIAMIKYIQSQGQEIWGFELGNEVNNRHVTCDLQPAQQAAAFKLFKEAVLEKLYPDEATRPKLLGPDIGYLDPKEYLGEFLGNFSDLHAVTYHVYSWLQRKNYDFTMPVEIDNALRDGEGWYPGMIKALAPGAEVWAGEDGPIGGGEDGTCGAFFANGTETHNSVCGTFATAPWYANDLGLRAVLGFKQYQRQPLNATPRMTPDFWVNFMWKRVMGNRVLNLTVDSKSSLDSNLDSGVRAYAHCGLPPSRWHAHSNGYEGVNGYGVVLVNINSTATKSVRLTTATTTTASTRTPDRTPTGTSTGTGTGTGATGAPALYTFWLLRADPDPKSAHTTRSARSQTDSKAQPELPPGVFGQDSLLNGYPLPQFVTNGTVLERIPVVGKTSDGRFDLPPFSVTFAVSSSAACPLDLDISPSS